MGCRGAGTRFRRGARGGGGAKGGHGRSADLVAVEGLVVGALLVGELHPHHHLLLLWQVLHVLLHAPKKNGPQLLLQPHTAKRCYSWTALFLLQSWHIFTSE